MVSTTLTQIVQKSQKRALRTFAASLARRQDLSMPERAKATIEFVASLKRQEDAVKRMEALEQEGSATESPPTTRS